MIGSRADDSIIVVRKNRRGSGKGHGSSAWKIAFADFTLSMMAVFLVLWVISMTTSDQQKEIAKYFNDPGGVFEDKGFPSAIDFGGGGEGTMIARGGDPVESSPMWGLYQELQESGLSALGNEYSDTLSYSILAQGIKVQLTESIEHPMFDRGGRYLTPYFEDLLLNLAPYLAGANRPITITGHSDATPFNPEASIDNWDLSSIRAHQARRTLIYGGVPEDMIAKVSAMSDQKPILDNPNAAGNRRVEILVLSDQGIDELGGFEMPDREPVPMPDSAIRSAQERAAANQIPRN